MSERDERVFHLGDVLSITTSLLVSPRYMDGVYELLRFLTGAAPQLPALAEEIGRCRGYLLRTFPELADVDASSVQFENWQAWLSAQIGAHGEFLTVPRPRPDELGPPGARV